MLKVERKTRNAESHKTNEVSFCTSIHRTVKNPPAHHHTAARVDSTKDVRQNCAGQRGGFGTVVTFNLLTGENVGNLYATVVLSEIPVATVKVQ